VDLRELGSFVAVAEELHFGKAARRTHLSQPALSQQIQRLEKEFGFALFTRNRRRVALTPAGGLLVERARQLLDDADEMIKAASRVASGRAGSLRIGYVGAAPYGALPGIIRRLHENAPDVEVSLVEYKTVQQLALLEQGRLDAGFIHVPAQPLDGFHVTELSREKLCIALAAGHRLAAPRRVRLAELADEPFVMFPPALEPDTHERIMRACAGHGFAPRVTQQASTLQAVIGLVAAGLGAAFVSASVAQGMHRDAVVFRPLSPPVLELTNGIAWREDHDNPAISSLQSALGSVVDDDVA
jgi:DNA-binding transcriptional LysR family regulator